MATSNFGKAFRAAREAGDKEFEFGGKKYNTKMKDEDSAPSKTDASALAAKGQAGNEEMKKDEEAPVKKVAPVKEADPVKEVAPKKQRETYRDLKGKVQYKEDVKPPSEYEPGTHNIKRNLLSAPSDIASGLKTAGSAAGNYLDKTFSMEGREQAKKEGKERYGMKKGGAVSASSRGDGIAQRGKTRGKMC